MKTKGLKEEMVFSFKAPNGAIVNAVAVTPASSCVCGCTTTWLCYAQNRLFLMMEIDAMGKLYRKLKDVIVDYIVLPKLDSYLEDAERDNTLIEQYIDEC